MDAHNNRDQHIHQGSTPDSTAPVMPAIPAGFRLIPEAQATPAVHHFGYHRNERFIIAAFHPEAADVMWKDGHESGFAAGAWDYYFRTLLPPALRQQADLTDQSHIGQDVLLIDRVADTIYIAPRLCAEEFLAQAIGMTLSHRRCMCARPLEGQADCRTCPAWHRSANDISLHQAEASGQSGVQSHGHE